MTKTTYQRTNKRNDKHSKEAVTIGVGQKKKDYGPTKKKSNLNSDKKKKQQLQTDE